MLDANDSVAGAQIPAYAFAGNSSCDRNEEMAFRVWLQSGRDFAQDLIDDLWLYCDQDCACLADDQQVIGGGFDLEPALEGASPRGGDIRDDQIAGAEYLVLDQPVCERLGHVAAPDEAKLLHGGRSPNTARPTRTMVAPSSIATSKSSVMPIESSPKRKPLRAARVSRISRKRVKYGRECSARCAGGGIAISPATSTWSRTSASRRSASPGGIPRLLVSAPRLISSSTRVGGVECTLCKACASRVLSRL